MVSDRGILGNPNADAAYDGGILGQFGAAARINPRIGPRAERSRVSAIKEIADLPTQAGGANSNGGCEVSPIRNTDQSRVSTRRWRLSEKAWGFIKGDSAAIGATRRRSRTRPLYQHRHPVDSESGSYLIRRQERGGDSLFVVGASSLRLWEYWPRRPGNLDSSLTFPRA